MLHVQLYVRVCCYAVEAMAKGRYVLGYVEGMSGVTVPIRFWLYVAS